MLQQASSADVHCQSFALQLQILESLQRITHLLWGPSQQFERGAHQHLRVRDPRDHVKNGWAPLRTRTMPYCQGVTFWSKAEGLGVSHNCDPLTDVVPGWGLTAQHWLRHALCSDAHARRSTQQGGQAAGYWGSDCTGTVAWAAKCAGEWAAGLQCNEKRNQVALPQQTWGHNRKWLLPSETTPLDSERIITPLFLIAFWRSMCIWRGSQSPSDQCQDKQPRKRCVSGPKAGKKTSTRSTFPAALCMVCV